MIRLDFSNMEVFMRTLRKISIVLMSVLMIFTLSIGAYAEAQTRNELSFSFQGCVYTPLVAKTDEGDAVICFTAIRGSDAVEVTICDSNHRPISNTTMMIYGACAIHSAYHCFNNIGNSYCLRICSDNYANVSGNWAP